MFSLLLAVIYLAFIGLGLPDSLLGAAWPTLYPELGVPVSRSGIVFAIIALGTIVSSLQSDRLTKRFGAGPVTAASVAATAVALLGFSTAHSLSALCLWAIPYGLGAGSVDAALNNYVALHYASRHMSWLHCMWGVGATAGPYAMGLAIASGAGWAWGYRSIGIVQVAIAAALAASLPLWRRRERGAAAPAAAEPDARRPIPLRQALRIPGAAAVLVCFFCYCAIEQTAGLWAATFLTLARGVPPERAAFFASLFFLGITLGRGLGGFLTLKLDDDAMVHLGEALIAIGAALAALPLGPWPALAGFVVAGFGCAPVYPCIIHSTPAHFGADKSQAIIGVQMASAYTGTMLMPPLFGLVARHVSVALLPLYLFALLALMTVLYERTRRLAPAAGN